MKLEYLVGNELKDYDFEKFRVDKNVVYEIKKIPRKLHFILVFSIPKDDVFSARILSKVHTRISEDLNPTVLVNQVSEFYISKLYPMIINLELRVKQLYIMASVLSENEDEKSKDNIQNLEQMTLGELLTLLFTDKKFNESVRDIFKKGDNYISYQISKKHFISKIETFSERTPWQNLMGDKVPTLRESFVEVIEFRNSIAHVKSILENDYFKIKKLFEKINDELSSAIEIFTNSQQHNPTNIDFNNYLYSIFEDDSKSKSLTFNYSFDDEILMDYLGNKRLKSTTKNSKENLFRYILDKLLDGDKEE